MDRTGPSSLGSHYYAAADETLARNRAAATTLKKLPRTTLVNLLFRDESFEEDGFETHACLSRDSCTATGRKGPRKPLARETFDSLARLAEESDHPFFAWINADIAVEPEFIGWIDSMQRDCFFFSRTDIGAPETEENGMFWFGIDLFVFRVSWWKEHRTRFRNYVIGDGLYDTIFTSIALSHSNGILVNNRSLIFHQFHPRVWAKSPFSDWNIFLSCRDFLYVERWHEYSGHLMQRPPEDFNDDEAEQLQREVFHSRFPISSRIVQAGRAAKAYIRYRLNRAGLTPSIHYPI